jgi:hypothetical protein
MPEVAKVFVDLQRTLSAVLNPDNHSAAGSSALRAPASRPSTAPTSADTRTARIATDIATEQDRPPAQRVHIIRHVPFFLLGARVAATKLLEESFPRFCASQAGRELLDELQPLLQDLLDPAGNFSSSAPIQGAPTGNSQSEHSRRQHLGATRVRSTRTQVSPISYAFLGVACSGESRRLLQHSLGGVTALGEAENASCGRQGELTALFAARKERPVTRSGVR